MSASSEWLDSVVKLELEKDQVCILDDNQAKDLKKAFDAGRESVCSKREAYQRGHLAGEKKGRAEQREADAVIVESNWRGPNGETLYLGTIAKAIREQELSDD